MWPQHHYRATSARPKWGLVPTHAPGGLLSSRTEAYLLTRDRCALQRKNKNGRAALLTLARPGFT